ncbi:MAG: PKD domain-containing protein, partial [Candidatus Anammoxibacter sp.]
FRDLSSSPTGDIIGREWDFGDETKSSVKDPEHTYEGIMDDTFAVTLTVQDSQGIDTETKQSFVSLEEATVEFIPTPDPTPTATPLPGELSSLNVKPEESRRALLPRIATVTALDTNGNPLEGVAIKASASGTGANVRPKERETGRNGTARFIFKFGLNTNSRKKITFTAEELSVTIIERLTARPTPTPKPTPGELFSLKVKPEEFRRAQLPRIAIVTALDRKGNPIQGIIINASASGSIANVRPKEMKTGRNGTAEFIFRFGIFASDGKITFTSDELNVTITQDR